MSDSRRLAVAPFATAKHADAHRHDAVAVIADVAHEQSVSGWLAFFSGPGFSPSIFFSSRQPIYPLTVHVTL